MIHPRVIAFVLAVAAGTAASSTQVRPPTGQIDDVLRAEAQKHAEDLAGRSSQILGSVSTDAIWAIRRWDLAVKAWKKERSAGAAPLLAEGVLFDCLSRLHGIITPALSSEHQVPYFADLAAQRPSRAARAFEAALKVDQSLTEARFRLARIRSQSDLSFRLQLEQLSEVSGPIAYLAAMSLAESLRGVGDSSGAKRWYERATTINPRGPAAAIGLGSLGGAPVPIPFDVLDSVDAYYSYPCKVLTPQVDAELAERARRVFR